MNLTSPADTYHWCILSVAYISPYTQFLIHIAISSVAWVVLVQNEQHILTTSDVLK